MTLIISVRTLITVSLFIKRETRTVVRTKAVVEIGRSFDGKSDFIESSGLFSQSRRSVSSFRPLWRMNVYFQRNGMPSLTRLAVEFDSWVRDLDHRIALKNLKYYNAYFMGHYESLFMSRSDSMSHRIWVILRPSSFLALFFPSLLKKIFPLEFRTENK